MSDIGFGAGRTVIDKTIITHYSSLTSRYSLVHKCNHLFSKNLFLSVLFYMFCEYKNPSKYDPDTMSVTITLLIYVWLDFISFVYAIFINFQAGFLFTCCPALYFGIFIECLKKIPWMTQVQWFIMFAAHHPLGTIAHIGPRRHLHLYSGF